LQLFERACDGLCCSNEMREAGSRLLQSHAAIVAAWASTPMPLDRLFGLRLRGQAEWPATMGEAELAAAFAQHRAVWEVLVQQAPQRQALVVSLVRNYPGNLAATADAVAAALQRLSRLDAPQVSGKAVVQLEHVPPHLRGALIVQVTVLARLLGVGPDGDTGPALQRFLNGHCGGLLDHALDEWFVPGGRAELKQQYQTAAKSKTKASKK
jgi:hypothetical protein